MTELHFLGFNPSFYQKLKYFKAKECDKTPLYPKVPEDSHCSPQEQL